MKKSKQASKQASQHWVFFEHKSSSHRKKLDISFFERNHRGKERTGSTSAVEPQLSDQKDEDFFFFLKSQSKHWSGSEGGRSPENTSYEKLS